MSYPTPRALQSALNDRAKRRAVELGVSSSDLVQRWYYQALLARVFSQDPGGWLLKGGQALLVRFDHTARHSRDIDLYRPVAADLAEAERALVASAETQLDDHLRFEYHSRRQRTDGAATTQIKFNVYLGTKHLGLVNVDVIVGLAPIGEPVVRELEPAVGSDYPANWPSVQLYPLVDHLADKVLAMYELHGPKLETSSRWRDLVDIVLIALRETVHGQQLRAAVHSEHQRRTALGTTVQLPETFVVPNQTTWRPGYAKEAAHVPGLEQYRTLDAAAALADVFLSPVLNADSTDPGHWLFEERRWSSKQ